MKHPLSLPSFLVAVALAGSAFPALTDFRIPDGAKFSVDGKPGRLAVTPDDRFVLILDETNKAVKILDTWNFSLVSGSISLSDKPVAIAISPTGDNAYITLSNGIVDVVDISALADLGLNDSLSSLSPQPAVADTLNFSSSALGDIAITNLTGSATADYCVFALDGDTIRWFKESTPGTLGAFTISNCAPGELEGGGKYLFILCDNDVSGKATLEQFACLSSGGPTDQGTSFILGNEGDFLGLSLAPDYEWLLAGETVNKNLILIDASPTVADNFTILDSVAVSIPMKQVLATDFTAEAGPIAFPLDNTDLLLAQMNATPDAFTGDTTITLPIAGGGYLARSSASDQYVYLSLAGGETVAVVTANPWVEITSATLTQGDTTGTGTLTIKFTSNWIATGNGSYAIKLASGFKTGTALSGGSGTMASGDTVTKTLSVTGLREGQNVISVEVTAGGRTGRDAVAITGACGATPVNFSLDFGTGKIIVRFQALDCSSVEKYEIYYGLGGTCEASAQDYDVIDATGGDGEPPSPIEITAPDPGEEIEEVVEGLQNGETYRVQVVSYDDSGGLGISARKCILVERVLTLTDRAGEDGGFDCFGINPGGGVIRSGVWVLILPLLGLGIIRLAGKWRRGNWQGT